MSVTLVGQLKKLLLSSYCALCKCWGPGDQTGTVSTLMELTVCQEPQECS